MKRFFLLLLLFLVACEPAEPETMAPAPDPAPEVEAPAVSEPEDVEEPVIEESENEEAAVDVDPPVEEPQTEEPDSETSTEESSEESTTEETETTTEETEESEESTVFTAQTLAYYDGQEGRPAYVAVNGVVYDVTSSSRWRDGAHNGFQAGRDLTRQFNNQHGDSRLGRFPIVGTYTD